MLEGRAPVIRTSEVRKSLTLVLWLTATTCISGNRVEQCHLGTSLPWGVASLGQQRRSRASVMVSPAVDEKVGVANQHSSLLALLTVAVAAQVDKILLPPTLSRSEWTDTAEWREGPSEDLWDRESIEKFIRPGGVQLQAGRHNFAQFTLHMACHSTCQLSALLSGASGDTIMTTCFFDEGGRF